MSPNISSTGFLWALCAVAVVLIFAIPSFSLVLLPAAVDAWKTGRLPDGLPLRKFYTGFMPLDVVFMAYGGIFSAAVDGRDEATHLFCVWFLPQLCTVLLFTYWEAGRARGGLVAWPTFVCILAQFLTAGVVLPAYFASHIQNIPIIPEPFSADARIRAQTVLPAVILGFLVPSWFLVFPPRDASLDTIQKISAAWQPFPLYIYMLLHALHTFSYRITGPSAVEPSRGASVLASLKRSYQICGLFAALAHFYVFVPSLITTVPSHSFANVFIPFWLHPFLPMSLPATPLAAYRPCSRLLFQYDWLLMTTAALTFFGRSQVLTQTGSRTKALGGWTLRTLLVSIVGGPGAALAWAAIQREETIAAAQA